METVSELRDRLEKGAEKIGEVLSKALNGSKTCSNCSHVKTCLIFRNFTYAIQSISTENWTPINPEDLAKICEEFALMSMTPVHMELI